MLHEQLTGQILEACFSVSNELGCGFLESVYHKALSIVLTEKGLSHENEVSLNILFHGNNVGHFVADIVVENKVVVEIKAIKGLAPEHSAQTINYLRGTGMEVGLLINFGQPKLEYRRLERLRSYESSVQHRHCPKN